MRITTGYENNESTLIPNSKNKIQTFLNSSELIDYSISFSGLNENYCLGIVDMVDSTKISACLDNTKLSKYFSFFLNSMALIVQKNGATVLKNLGDSLLYYFPETSNAKDDFGFVSCLECGLQMLAERININSTLIKDNLPPLSYRVSADYGNVLLARSQYSPCIDIFGPSVNICAKINKAANKNSYVIGGDLYQVIKKSSNYIFKNIGSYDSGFQRQYPIYEVTRGRHTDNGKEKV